MDARNIRGHQVRSKLDTPEGAANRVSQGTRQGGFAYSWYIFDEDMATAHDGSQAHLDNLALAHQHLLHVGLNPLRNLGHGVGRRRFRCSWLGHLYRHQYQLIYGRNG